MINEIMRFTPATRPHIFFPDAIYAIWCWFLAGSKKNHASRKLEAALKKVLGADYAFSFNAARAGIYVALKALGIGKGDEVLLQGYTFVAVPNAIRWTGAMPVYVDIEEASGNIDPKKIEKKITKRTKAIIVQHSFGLPAAIDKILPIAKKHNMFVIEDCAHAFGATYKGKPVGLWGDVGIYSFGPMKVIDSSSGGVLVTNKRQIAALVEKEYKKLSLPPTKWTRGQLTFLLSNYFLRRGELGERLYQYFRQKKWIPVMLHPKEALGYHISVYPSLMPEALARLTLKQLPQKEAFRKHREALVMLYTKYFQNTEFIQPMYANGRLHLFFLLRHKYAQDMIALASTKGLQIESMFGDVIGPTYTKLSAVAYTMGMCPVAEQVAKESMELPTGIQVSKKEALAIAKYIQDLAEHLAAAHKKTVI